MKKVNGFKSEAPKTGYPMLPAGAYVCGIKNVNIDGQEPDQQLVLRLDIIEGEYAGYYTKRYDQESRNLNSRYPAKYKGDLAIQIPNEANTKRSHHEWDLNTFNRAIGAIEATLRENGYYLMLRTVNTAEELVTFLHSLFSSASGQERSHHHQYYQV